MNTDNNHSDFQLPAPVNSASQQSTPGLPQNGGQPTPQANPGQVPATAEDADLIEKEWVQKAKEIVAATNHDPYAQNRELSRFKAAYLKKRYNKIVKLDES